MFRKPPHVREYENLMEMMSIEEGEIEARSREKKGKPKTRLVIKIKT